MRQSGTWQEAAARRSGALKILFAVQIALGRFSLQMALGRWEESTDKKETTPLLKNAGTPASDASGPQDTVCGSFCPDGGGRMSGALTPYSQALRAAEARELLSLSISVLPLFCHGQPAAF